MEELYQFVTELERESKNESYFDHTLKELENFGELITVTTISSIIVISISVILFITSAILSAKAIKRANKNKNKFLKIIERENLINKHKEEQNG